MSRLVTRRTLATACLVLALILATTPPAAAFQFSQRMLAIGARGEDVAELQRRLAALGFRVAVDGVFGPGTRRAVAAFQRSRGLGADGVVGAQTFRALLTGGQAHTSLDHTVHPVVPGDTLSGLAARYRTTVQAIMAANQLTRTTIYVGQRLRIPSAATAAAIAAAPTPGPGPQVHVVRAGETLSGIAARYGVTLTQLRQANQLRSDLIRVGQRLSVPPQDVRIASATAPRGFGQGGAGATAPAEPLRHTVAAGETLWAIATRYGVGVEALRTWNGLSDDLIVVGQVLTVSGPGTGAPAEHPAFGTRPLTGVVLVVDPGHGGNDVGTFGITSGIAESVITWDLATRLVPLLERAGATVVLTRTADADARVPEEPSLGPLASRVRIAERAGARLFLSIHADWYDDPGIHGASSWYHPRKPQDAALARVFQKHLVAATELADRGVRAGGYYVLNHTSMPAVLVETGLLSAARDEALLLDPAFRQKVAWALFEAVLEIFE